MHYKTLIEPWTFAWFWDEFVRAGPALVALAVGVTAGYVAWRQYGVARAKLNLDLFDRRLVVFDKIWSYAAQLDYVYPAKRPAFKDFHNAIPEAYFLFGSEIGDFMRTLENRALEFDGLHRELAQVNTTETRARQIKDRLLEISNEWLQTASTMALRDRFAHYMDFSAWKGGPSLWQRVLRMKGGR